LALPVAVNVTDTNIRLPSFVEDLLGSMAAQGIGTSLLEVEITETVLLDSSVEAVQANLAALSRAGIRIALDDFGTGFASLAHLKSYPVDQFKIDRQFVQSVITSPDDLAIINAMVGLGESLVMQVVAEGIETEAQRRILIAAGCEYGQGYLFSQAIPAEAVPGLLRPV
jgi:EAL domain-containing protein (putative c-di-GMP-specific phosphodiesterase class I)